MSGYDREYYKQWYEANRKRVLTHRRKKYWTEVRYRNSVLLSARLRWKLVKIMERFSDGDILIPIGELMKLKSFVTTKKIILPAIKHYKTGNKIPIRFYLIVLGIYLTRKRLKPSEWKEVLGRFGDKPAVTAKEVYEYVKENITGCGKAPVRRKKSKYFL